MQIILNGKPLTLDTPQSIAALLIDQGYTGKIVAVALNGEFVPKKNYSEHSLQNNDRIEIVAPMQGG